MTLNDAKEYTRWLAKMALYVLAAIYMFSLLPIGRDSTDADWPNRSGMGLKQDALTGCEYLISPYGGITPRYSAEGKHMGCISN